MDEPVCKRGKLMDTDSTCTNTHLDEISDNELCLPFINQFSYDIDKQDITQNSSMEDSSRGIYQEPNPNNTVKEQIYWSFQSSIPTFPAYYHGKLSHHNDNSKSREIGTKYLDTGRFTGGEVSPIEWSVTCDPYPQVWGTLLINVKVPVCIDTAAPRSYMT